jgi:Family of unknown function (DUF5330)
MFSLLRMALFLCVVLALLPTGGVKQDTATPSARMGASDAVAAASATVSDMWQFCTRQPQACAVGSHAAVTFGQRAEAGAKMVYRLVSERAAAPAETGSIADAARRPAAKSSQDTLTATDIAPPWHGPRRVAHNKQGA